MQNISHVIEREKTGLKNANDLKIKETT